MTSTSIQGCVPGASRVARAAWRLIGVTAITACSRVDAASVPERTMLAAEVITVSSFKAPPGTYDAVMAQRGKAHFNVEYLKSH